MKKSLMAIAALTMMMASCSQDETIEMTSREAITFDNNFVDNTTRVAYDGTYTTSKLSDFEVWSTISNNTGTANIFKKELVSKKVYTNDNGVGTNWKYNANNTQYWIPGNTYRFWAIADGSIDNVTSVTALDTDNNAPTEINLLDASQQKDILLASKVYEDYKPEDGTTVNFTFEHLLAKAKFTVKNTIKANSGYSYKVSGITLVNTAKNGVYDIEERTWNFVETPDRYNLSFGDAVLSGSATGEEAQFIHFNESKESNFERLLIPCNEVLTVSFKYELFKDEMLIDTEESKTITTQPVNLEASKAYNFVITLGNPGEEIKFSVMDVNGWNTNSDVEMK